MKIALFWYNFLEKNNLQQDYAFPFEGQKMCYYYANNNIVVGVPDDVDVGSASEAKDRHGTDPHDRHHGPDHHRTDHDGETGHHLG